MGTGIHNAKVEGIKEGGELPRLCNFIAESAIRFLSKLSCRWRRSYRAAHHASSHGLVAPKRVPEDRILTMQNLVKEALADPDVQAKFAKAGLTTDYLSADDFQKALDNMWTTIGDIMRENKFN